MSNFTKTDAGRELALGMQAFKRLAQPASLPSSHPNHARWVTGDIIQCGRWFEALSESLTEANDRRQCHSTTSANLRRVRTHRRNGGLAMPSLWFNLGKGRQQVKAYRTSLALGAHI